MIDPTDEGPPEAARGASDSPPATAPSASPHPTDSHARAVRAEIECVVLPARPGSVPSRRPPVEIFLGTEPAQYRANRVFAWSIEKVRDPGREVRIHVMSELPDFDRRFWTTGFTNYRFALPALVGGHGRAIYNDEDQIYLTDPGELFDHEMGDAGYLAISDTESSVMLVDCERMSDVWTLEEARHAWKRSLLRKASKATGHRGDLEPGWNARDEEFRPGESHLLHYTTLHTQPWRPFPERFVYQKGSHTDLWHALEAEAIEAGFELFRQDAPSKAFEHWLSRLRALPAAEMGSGIGVSPAFTDAVEELTRRTKTSSLLELTPDLRGDAEQRPGRFGLEVERRSGLLEWLGAAWEDEQYGGVVCVDGLEELPVWDIPWLIESLFARAERFVFVAVRCPESTLGRRFPYPPSGTTHTAGWWRSHFEAASARHPEISWTLMTARGASFTGDAIHLARGGQRPDATQPTVWTLTDGEPGNDTQVEALAAALGWPTQARRPDLGAGASLPFVGLGAHLRALEANGANQAALAPPWPDLLIVAGRRVAAAARWVREQSSGRTLVVALGAKAGTPPEAVDLAVTPRGATLFPHPNRLEVDRPLVHAEPRRVGASSLREKLETIGSPRWLFVVGSGTHRLGIDVESAAALGRLVGESATAMGVSVLVSASRHADPEILEACLGGLGRTAFVHQETRDRRQQDSAWPALLSAADLFVMVGLGEATLAEITAQGKPVFLAPQRDAAPGFFAALRERTVNAIVSRAQARPANDRGTTRPQQGLELVCAKLIARGWVRPRRDIETSRGRLVRNGRARLLRSPIRAEDLVGFSEPLTPEVLRVAARVRAMLGVGRDDRGDAARSPGSTAHE